MRNLSSLFLHAVMYFSATLARVGRLKAPKWISFYQKRFSVRAEILYRRQRFNLQQPKKNTKCTVGDSYKFAPQGYN